MRLPRAKNLIWQKEGCSYKRVQETSAILTHLKPGRCIFRSTGQFNHPGMYTQVKGNYNPN
ncbi:MAG: hypothetical protein GY790_10855 [Bacteroidetes bacterium]|nr:hypothetical protein [Bacteroidota bacterium]